MTMAALPEALVGFVQQRFRALADPAKAGPMAAYMRTDMPFYGIQKPDRTPVYREIKRKFAPATQTEYSEAVIALWNLPHREEKYAAIEYASMFNRFINLSALPLFERLIRDGQWWDFVDAIAVALVGGAIASDGELVLKEMDAWIADDDMWIRRTALICQNRQKNFTDKRRLFEYCLKTAPEKEFFIRKAISWALREYSYSQPEAVKSFIESNRDTLSPLSVREGLKRIERGCKDAGSFPRANDA